jgi:hypothetical protein
VRRSSDVSLCCEHFSIIVKLYRSLWGGGFFLTRATFYGCSEVTATLLLFAGEKRDVVWRETRCRPAGDAMSHGERRDVARSETRCRTARDAMSPGQRRDVVRRGVAAGVLANRSTVTAMYWNCRVTRVEIPYGQNAESLSVNACGKHSNHRAFKGLA